MLLIGAIVAAAGLVWGLLIIRYQDLPLACMIFLAVTSVLSGDFFGFDAAGLTWTLDRFWLVFLSVQLAVSAWTGGLRWRQLQLVDVLLLAFVGWLVIRTVVYPLGSQLPEQPPTLMHLLNGYLIPVFLYASLRYGRITQRSIAPAVAVLLLLGSYLAATAIFESLGLWSLVWPRFIADPTLGIHFGRARGPMLQSVRLGICLNAALAAVWIYVLSLNGTRKWAWVMASSLTPLLMLAIYFTKTRSIWLGAIAILIVCLVALLRGRVRVIAFTGIAVGGLIGGLLLGPSLLAFKREYSAAETLESTRMRAAFAYVSWQMFQDAPLAGFGFNQFQVANPPYLDDRTTEIRVESIRGYVHHNSYLSIIVDLGLIGGVLWGATAAAAMQAWWRLSKNRFAPPWARANATFAACVVASHAIQMAFHEVSFSAIENSLLAIALGWMVSTQQDFATPDAVGAGWWQWSNRLLRAPALATAPNGP